MYEYKVGDKVRVINLPEGQKWWSPREDDDLKNGDILLLRDPPTYTDTNMPLVKKYGPCVMVKPNGIIPIAWIEPYTENKASKKCECNLWTTGCICGVFTAEQEKENNARF